jgi:hypothetical protein
MQNLLAGEMLRTRIYLPSSRSGSSDLKELAPATSRTKEKTMNDVTTIAQSMNHSSTSKIHHPSEIEVREANHDVRNMIILGLALEVVFLATLAAYEFSSIFRFQN